MSVFDGLDFKKKMYSNYYLVTKIDIYLTNI